MVRQRLTEKKMANRRFRKTEEAIFRVVNSEDYYIGTEMMAKKAGIARSTFYHHHKTVRNILPDYKQYLMRKYSRLINKLLRNNKLHVRAMYMNMLIFMIQHKKVFELLVKHNEAIIVHEMIVQMREKLVKAMRLPVNGDRMFMIYASEVAALICEWVNTGMSMDRVEGLLGDIIYLTETARNRLSPMRDN